MQAFEVALPALKGKPPVPSLNLNVRCAPTRMPCYFDKPEFRCRVRLTRLMRNARLRTTVGVACHVFALTPAEPCASLQLRFSLWI